MQGEALSLNHLLRYSTCEMTKGIKFSVRSVPLLLMVMWLVACGGGGGRDGAASVVPTPASFIVSATAGAGGTVSPASVTVSSGAITTFTFSASFGFEIDSASGCNGTLNGNSFSTGAVSSNCSVAVTYRPVSCSASDQTAPAGSIFDVATLSWSPGQNINGTAGNDRFVHAPINLQPRGSNAPNFKGGAGNDQINGNGWSLSVYWDSPRPVVVRLDQGCATDGFGARDTLTDIRGAFGSGGDDIFFGDTRNNVFWTMGGLKNYVNGGDGEDLVTLSMDPATATFVRKSATSWEIKGAPINNPTIQETATLDNIEVVQFYDNSKVSEKKLLTGEAPQEVKFGMPIRLSPSKLSIQSDFFAVDNFGFPIETINERSGAFYYPTEADLQPPGSFALDPHNMVTGDFNGDKREDLLVSWAVFNHTISHQTRTVPAIFLNKGDGTLGSANEVMTGGMPLRHFPYRMSVADFNGDSVDDVVMGTMINPNSPERLPGVQYNALSDPLILLLSQPGGKMADSSTRIEGQESGGSVRDRFFSHDMTVGDLDGDRDVDIYTSGKLLINDGTGRFADRSAVLPPEARRRDSYVMSSATGDFDGDGIKDLVVAYAEGSPRFMFLSNGSGISSARTVTLPDGTFGRMNTKSNYISTADVNRDGRIDILIAETRAVPYYVGRRIQILINQGNGVFADESNTRLDNQPFDTFHGEGQLYLRDMNGDAAIDIVHGTSTTSDRLGNDLSGGLNVFINDGSGKFRAVAPQAYAHVNRSDVDGFGLNYLISSGFPQRSVPIQLMPNGRVDFVSHVKVEWFQPEPPAPNAVILYVMRSKRPLN